MNKHLLFLILAFGLISISCSKEERIVVQKPSFQQELLDIEALNQIGVKVYKLQSKQNLKQSEYEEEMKKILLPLVNCGEKLIRTIQNEYVLDNSILTHEELIEINSMTDEQIACFAFVLSALQVEGVSNQKVDYVSCIEAALGLDIIRGLINNTAQMVTAKSAIKLLKVLAKRYIGWIGVGFAVYSFLDCIEVI